MCSTHIVKAGDNLGAIWTVRGKQSYKSPTNMVSIYKNPYQIASKGKFQHTIITCFDSCLWALAAVWPQDVDTRWRTSLIGETSTSQLTTMFLETQVLHLT